MHLFWSLVLAHFVGDFALQTDKIYFYKRTYRWGVSVHVAVCMGVKLFLLLPYLHLPRVWVILLVIALLHIFIDHGKIVLSVRYRSDNIWYFLIDQTLHLSSIMLLTWLLFDFKNPQPKNFFIARYILMLDINMLITLTGLVVSTFSGAPLIYYISDYLTKRGSSQEYNFPKFEKRVIGYIERFVSTVGMILGGWYLLLFLSFLLRYVLKSGIKNIKFSISETIMGIVLAVTVGLCVRI